MFFLQQNLQKSSDLNKVDGFKTARICNLFWYGGIPSPAKPQGNLVIHPLRGVPLKTAFKMRNVAYL